MAVFSSLRSAILAGLLLGSLGAAGLESFAAPPTVPRARRHEYRHEIEQVEDAWRNAMLKANSDALAALLSDDYTGITAKGEIQTKDQAVGSLKSGTLHVTSLSISDRKIRVYGATSVVTSLAELAGTRDDQELAGRYRYTRVYVRNASGQWKIVSFEASKIQEPGDRK